MITLNTSQAAFQVTLYFRRNKEKILYEDLAGTLKRLSHLVPMGYPEHQHSFWQFWPHTLQLSHEPPARGTCRNITSVISLTTPHPATSLQLKYLSWKPREGLKGEVCTPILQCTCIVLSYWVSKHARNDHSRPTHRAGAASWKERCLWENEVGYKDPSGWTFPHSHIGRRWISDG